MSGGRIVLGTRGSALALAQAKLTRAALLAAHPGLIVEVREFKTTGDKRQDLSLSSAVHGDGGEKIDKGLFTKELENALLAHEIDVAVHSLKDLPTANPPGLLVAAVLPRAPAEDVLISKYAGLGALPQGATVATSSVRRALQLQHLRPDLRVVEIRGNVGTRLMKLRDRTEWAGMLLARAGLERLGFDLSQGNLAHEGTVFGADILGPDRMLPAVGQGAIGLQARFDAGPPSALLAAINHDGTFAAVLAERALLRALGGGCQAPVGVSTRLEGTELHLRAVYFAEGERQPRGAHATGQSSDPEALGCLVAEKLLRG